MIEFKTITKASAFILALGGTACEQQPMGSTDWEKSLIEQGHDIAKQHCVACHNIDRRGDSLRSDAPPLRTLLANYNPEALADDFREHIHVGHPDMPDFDFNVKETEAILAYLKYIQITQETE